MSTLAAALEFAIGVVHVVGLPALFVVFVLKGALVGKVFPTSVVLPGYVVAVAPTYLAATGIVVLVTIAHVIGQVAVFVASRRYGMDAVGLVPYVEVDPDADRFRRVERWFDRYGGVAVFATNVVPWSRGLIAIPAGVGGYPSSRYVAHVGVSTLLYHGVYVAVPLAGLALLA